MNSKYKFIFSVSTIFLTIYTLYVASTMCYIFKPLYTPAEYWVPETKELKLRRLSQFKDTRKIIIVSGSNSLFGISSKLMEEKLGIISINMAMHAGFPMEYHIYNILQYVKKGDIIYLPFEYDLYNREFSNVMIDRYNDFTSWGTDYLSSLPYNTQFQIFTHSIKNYPLRLRHFNVPLPNKTEKELQLKNNYSLLTKNPYQSIYLNKYGEFLVDSSTVQRISEMQSMKYIAPPP